MPYSPSKAQTLIDTGPMSTDFIIPWPVDTSTTALIEDMPTFSSFLGTQTSVDLSGSLNFSWPEAVYSVGHDTLPASRPIATENVDINIYTGDYLKGSSDYENPFVGEAIFCTVSPKCPGFTIPNAAGSGSLGPINRTGTSIPALPDTDPEPTSIKAKLSSNFEGKGFFTASGNYKLSGTLIVDAKYAPLSTPNYVAEAITNSTSASALDTGYKSLSFISSLRNLDPGTSSTNVQLRDAQYALYGYKAGILLRTAQENLNPLVAYSAALGALGTNTGQGFGGPIALTIYNNLKAGAAPEF